MEIVYVLWLPGMEVPRERRQWEEPKPRFVMSQSMDCEPSHLRYACDAFQELLPSWKFQNYLPGSEACNLLRSETGSESDLESAPSAYNTLI